MKKLFKGKRLSILGFAKSGIASANLAKSLGAVVLISDINKNIKAQDKYKITKGIEIELGKHSSKILRADLIIKSPGIHNDIDILKKARRENIPVWGEIEFAYRLIKPKKILAVTGTNGKTTTTTLLGKIFKKAGHKTVVAGNIGHPLAGLVKKIDSNTHVVLEVSSYQLEDSFSFHPNVCSILNITPDHLEHHYSMKNYIKAKKRVFKNQNSKDFCILNYDDPICRKISEACPSKVVFFSRKKILNKGVFYKQGKICVNIGKLKYKFGAQFKIPGMHNIENILAAVAMASVSNIKPSVIKKAVYSFTGVGHRIEFVSKINGVKYFNDSKGTNVDSARVALESFDKNIWLILGGRDKGSPYKPLSDLIREKVKGVFLIGEAASKIKNELKGTTAIYDVKTMQNAVSKAHAFAKKGDIVLLSPACASFDQFNDYEDRGRQFKKMVISLEKNA
ncbi:MAG: UDP-N-acetylmuramoyl-L-alanine--D-glutamate ligase [Elusimicrobia bacterium]|nr:UDP-N-acetylmuramoyl-L-alanine--D-glutamate ligase [Elusimicrobiota bacterium]